MPGRVAWIHIAPIKAHYVDEVERVRFDARGIAESRCLRIVDDECEMLNA